MGFKALTSKYDPQLAGAIGAAILAAEKVQTKNSTRRNDREKRIFGARYFAEFGPKVAQRRYAQSLSGYWTWQMKKACSAVSSWVTWAPM